MKDCPILLEIITNCTNKPMSSCNNLLTEYYRCSACKRKRSWLSADSALTLTFPAGGGVNILFDDRLGLSDFHLPNKTSILYVSESDVIAGNSYKRKLVCYRNVSETKWDRGCVEASVSCSPWYQLFSLRVPGLQPFPGAGVGGEDQTHWTVLLCCAEVCAVWSGSVSAAGGWTDGSVAAHCSNRKNFQHQAPEMKRLSQVYINQGFVQMCIEARWSPCLQIHREGRENPFRRRTSSRLLEPSVLTLVQHIPGVGRVKALSLLQTFSSIQQLCNADLSELESIVGQASAQQVHNFFHRPLLEQKEQTSVKVSTTGSGI